MGIINFQSSVDQIETSSYITKVSSELHKIFVEKGNSIISDEKALYSLIDKMDCSDTSKQRLRLVFSCTSVRNYLSGDIKEVKDNLKMTQIDNMIHVICTNTGLTYISAVETLSEILCSLGIDRTITYSPVLEENKIEYKIHTVMPPAVMNDLLAIAFTFYESKGKKSKAEVEEFTEIVKQLCSAGVADGFYLLSKCYAYGYYGYARSCIEKADEMLRVAADAGSSYAMAELADQYYDNDSDLKNTFEEAYYYYTKPGSGPLAYGQGRNLEDIYSQRRENKFTLFSLVVLIVLFAVFVGVFNKGMFTDFSCLTVGIIGLVLSLVIFAVTVFYHFKKSQFNSIRVAVFAPFIVFVLYAFILELA